MRYDRSTRAGLLREFKVNETGNIMNPGKFRGEQLYVPYFWDVYLIVGADEEAEHGELIFEVTDEERAQFPELQDSQSVMLFETEEGFVIEVR